MDELLKFNELLAESARRHDHLCPRQVIGVRMGMLAGKLLQLDLPQTNKRLFTFLETDGCFADGVTVSTGCTLGHRTLRLFDYGKAAATFVDTETEQAVRIAPSHKLRGLAVQMTPDAKSHWHAQLAAYQHILDEMMFDIAWVTLDLSMTEIISLHGVRVNCTSCGEEIINQREVIVNGQPFCRACAGDSYYHSQQNVSLIEGVKRDLRNISQPISAP
jgi:formylmethanofuran dehydrogenase subunit E